MTNFCLRPGSFLILLTAAMTLNGELHASQSATIRMYEIRAGSLDSALTKIITLGGGNLLYSPRDIAQLKTEGIVGLATFRDALSRTLNGTGFTVLEVSPGNYVLRRAKAEAKIADSPGVRDEGPVDFPPVTITGSRIDRLSVWGAPPLTIISRDEIASSGQNSLSRLLVQNVLFEAHRSIDVASDQGSAVVPQSAASGASLSGFGPRGTLILINGKRVPGFPIVSGSFGTLLDLDSIPVAFIDRIEIATEGASAVYGSDAMGGVVNIIMRESMAGAEMTVRGGEGSGHRGSSQGATLNYSRDLADGHFLLGVDIGRRQGIVGRQRNWVRQNAKRDSHVDTRYPLGEVDLRTGGVAANCPGADPITSERCLFDRALYASLTPDVGRASVRATYSDYIWGGDFTGGFFISHGKARIEMPPAMAAFPRGEKLINYAFFDVGPINARTRSSLSGVDLDYRRMNGSWSNEVSAYRRDNSSESNLFNLINRRVAPQLINDGFYSLTERNEEDAAERIRAQGTNFSGRSWVQAASISASIRDLTFGEFHSEFSGGVEVRQDGLNFRAHGDLSKREVYGFSYGSPDVIDRRTTTSAFAELGAELPAHARLEIAARADYSDRFGLNVSPRVSFKYDISSTFAFRSTWGLGYREPTAFELREPPIQSQFAWKSKQGFPGGCNVAPFHFQGEELCGFVLVPKRNAGLQPERSRSWTAGIMWAPDNDFELIFDYYKSIRKNEIDHDGVSIIRDGAAFVGDAVSSGANGLPGFIDIKFSNHHRTEVSRWKVESRSRFPMRAGSLSISSRGIFNDIIRRFGPTGIGLPPSAGPRWRLMLRATWDVKPWQFHASISHRARFRPSSYAARLDPYLVYDFSFLERESMYGGRPPSVPSMTTLDVGAAYEKEGQWNVLFNILNLTSRSPVNLDGSLGGMTFPGDDPVGRYFSVEFSKFY